MRRFWFCVVVAVTGCAPETRLINDTTWLVLTQASASRGAEVSPEVYDPPLGPGDDGPLTWHHAGGTVYWVIELVADDGSTGTMSWAVGLEPTDFVIDDEVAE
ncbi:MAG: hypothetical protein ABMB14_38305, partial [Myxococcota bacterium]